MTRTLTMVALLLLAQLPSTSGGREGLGEGAPGAPTPPAAQQTRFDTVEIVLDSGRSPLAAYQLELHDASGSGVARIVGIEGGDHPAFAEPPHYDPKAIQNDRVILAAFSTRPAAELPVGRTRVATVHVEIRGDAQPRWNLKLVTAADADAERIEATAQIGGDQR